MKSFYIATGVVAGLFALVATLVLVPAVAVAKKWQGEIDRIRSAGEPLTLEELAETYPPPQDEHNAESQFLQAGTLLQELDPKGEQLKLLYETLQEVPVEENLAAATHEAVAEYLAGSGEVLALVGQACQLPHANYPLDFSLGIKTQYKHLPLIRNLVRLLIVQSYCAARCEDAALMVDTHAQLRDLTESLADEPASISQVVRIAFAQLRADSLARDLPEADLSAEDLDELNSHWTEEDNYNIYQRMVIGERCIAFDIIQGIAAGNLEYKDEGMREVVEKWKSSGPVFDLSMKYQQTELLRSFRRQLELDDKTWAERMAAAEEALDYGKAELVLKFLAVLLEGDFADWMRVFARERAVAAQVKCASGIEAFRLEFHRLPLDLNELVPRFLAQVPVDPFDDQPMRYCQSNNSYVVYSVYLDGKDDGGVMAKKDENGKYMGDWVLEVRRRPYDVGAEHAPVLEAMLPLTAPRSKAEAKRSYVAR